MPEFELTTGSLTNAHFSATDIRRSDGLTPAPTEYGRGIEMQPGDRIFSLLADAFGMDDLASHSKSMEGANAQPVTIQSSLGLEAIYSCISILVELVGMTDLVLFKRTEDGKEPAVDHYAYDATRFAPSGIVSGQQWRETMMYHALTSHGGFSRISFNPSGRTRMTLFDPNRMAWGMVPMTNELGFTEYAVIYQYWHDDPNNSGGHWETLLPEEVFHLKSFSIDGVMGTTPLRLCADTIAMMLACRNNIHRYHTTGGSTKGFFIIPPGTPPEQLNSAMKIIQTATERLQKASGMKAVPLPDGIKWVPASGSAVDAQMVELEGMTPKKAARIFKVPLSMLAEGTIGGSAGTDIDTEVQRLVMFTLQTWFKRIQTEADMKLITEQQWKSGEYFHEFDHESTFQGSWDKVQKNSREDFIAGVCGFAETRGLRNKASKPDDWFFIPKHLVGGVMWNPGKDEFRVLEGPDTGGTQSMDESTAQLDDSTVSLNGAALKDLQGRTIKRLASKLSSMCAASLKTGKFDQFKARVLDDAGYYESEIRACLGVSSCTSEMQFDVVGEFFDQIPPGVSLSTYDDMSSSLISEITAKFLDLVDGVTDAI